MADTQSSKTFLGVGWAFPFDIASDATVSAAVYEKDVVQAIRIIL
jgi:hypothetical protein